MQAKNWWRLYAYQQQRAAQQRIATKPAATLKPQAAKKAKSLARKAKQPPHAAPPKPLPKPNPLPKTNTSTNLAYRPVKTAKPLPPATRVAVANSQPRTNQPESTPSAARPIMNLGDVDQAVRGCADEYEFFYIAEKRVIGISIPFESDDPVTLLEAASALGYCHAVYEDSDMEPGEVSWLSINDSDDSIIYTSYAA